jgi:hypothetical protein
MIRLEQLYEAIDSGDYIGFCLNCDEIHYYIEPDARNVECDFCGLNSVYGAEEILLMGEYL